MREATTRFELKSLQKNRIERGLLGTLILVAPNLHQTARRDLSSPNVRKVTKIKDEHTLSKRYLVYRLSTTRKSEIKAVKGSAEQIHFTPLLLFVVGDISPLLKRARLEALPSNLALITEFISFQYGNLLYQYSLK